MVSRSFNAYGVHIEDTHRTACVRFSARSFFRFHAQMPHSSNPAMKAVMGRPAPGAVDAEIEGISEDEPTDLGREGWKAGV